MATRYDRFGTSEEPEKTKVVVGAGEGEQERGSGMGRVYVVVGIVVLILILGVLIYFLFFANRCQANPLFLQDQLDAIKRSASDVGSYCGQERSADSCNSKVYYIYTDMVNVASDARRWNYNEVQADVEGMRYWGTLENVCYWQ